MQHTLDTSFHSQREFKILSDRKVQHKSKINLEKIKNKDDGATTTLLVK